MKENGKSLEFLQNTEYGRYAKEILDFFVPLAMQLPSLRQDPSLMRVTVKTVGATGRQDVVTEADRFMQTKIKEEVEKRHQDWQFWGEEGEDNISAYDTTKTMLVITDPIEGTINFSEGRDDNWGSVIALVDIKTMEPVIGIVAHPTEKRMYVGIKDQGAYIFQYDDDNQLVAITEMPKEPENGHGEFTYNNSPHFDESLSKAVERFLALEEIKNAQVVDLESGALEVVRNRGTIYFKTSNEMAAVFVILQELGGVVTDADGQPWHLGIYTLIAARNKSDYDYLKSLYDKATVEDPETSSG